MNTAHQSPQVADLIVAYLEELGIEYVFGIPGGAIEPLYNALARSSRRGGPRPLVARHETGAAFMADGYARETGKIGVCCSTSGPGATNLITGVACAYENKIPLLVISAQSPLTTFGRGAMQESSCTGIDTLGMFRHCTQYNTLVSHPEQIEPKLAAALMKALHPPRGPVHLSIPVDILKSPAPVPRPSYRLADKLRPAALLDAAALAALHELLLGARQPRLLIGRSCGAAVDRILELAELRDIPFITTPDGKGLVNPHHPLFRGVFGFAGHRAAVELLRDPATDLVLAIGTNMNEWTSGAWSKALLNDKLVHIDESPEHLAQSPMARLHVRGSIGTVFDALLERLRSAPLRPSAGRTAASDPQALLLEADKYLSEATPIKPQRLMRELGRLLPPGTRFFADTGNSLAWAIHYLHADDHHLCSRRGEGSGWLRLAVDFTSMGWAIGNALGAAAADRTRPVLCITGDGSLLMSGQEITVAVAERLNVIFVVLNDRALGMVKHGQLIAGAERIATELPPTDFAALARAMGAEACTVRSPADLAALDFAALCAQPGPSLIDVHIDGEESPPIGLRVQVLGTPPSREQQK